MHYKFQAGCQRAPCHNFAENCKRPASGDLQLVKVASFPGLPRLQLLIACSMQSKTGAGEGLGMRPSQSADNLALLRDLCKVFQLLFAYNKATDNQSDNLCYQYDTGQLVCPNCHTTTMHRP